MTPLEIRPLANAAAEVVGVDVTALTVGDWNQLQAAFAAFGLLVFRDQILSEQDHAQFAERWGSPLDINDGQNAPERSEPGYWCADGSYLAKPPLGTVEVVREMPDNPTVRFASAYTGFDSLASITQRALESLSAIHEYRNNTTSHPIVVRHPISGRNALFLNPTFTSSVVDMDDDAGLALLNQLFKHILTPESLVEIEWEPGTVIVSDNRAMLRFAQSGTGRIDRIAIEGCELRPAIPPEKRDRSLTERAGATLAGGILTAAMAGIAEVIDPERVKHEIEIVSEAPERQPITGLDFGDLDPLD